MPRAMKCDFCDSPAVVHETSIKHGVKHEIHLCEEHAKAAGLAVAGHQPIEQLLTQFVVTKSGSRARTSRKTCPTCGMSFAKFRQAGVVGCPDCYEAFEKRLGPMIERAQNGGTSHCGKCPRRGGGSIDRQLRIQRMIKDLEDAVAAEQYERAAELRDRLQALESEVPAAEPGSAAPERA